MCYKCNDITVGNEGCIKCHSGVANLTGLICDTCLSGEEIDDLLYAK